MDSVVKKSLRVPIRKLTSCVSGVKKREVLAKRWNRRSRGGGRGGGGGGGGGGCSRLGKSPTPRTGHFRDPMVICSYQTDLEKERKQREAMNAQKNAERAAMRAHFRRKYQLSKNSKDTNHLRSVGGKVSLPRELAKIICPETKSKDDGYNLLRAFQGLSFNVGVFQGSKQSKTPTPLPANGDPCKVM